MEKQKGIYIIGNLTEKKVYVGSSIDVDKRIKKHFSQLKHDNHDNYKLKNAFNKDNTQFFAIPIPVTEDDVDIRKLEQILLDEFAPKGVLYNIAVSVETPMIGKKHSEETIQKLKELSIGRVPPKEAIENSIKARLGVPLSPERKEALRISSTEAMKDPAARQHLSDVNIGIKHTPEDIQKMKDICVGRTFTPQARAASLEASIGRKMSDEHLAIIKVANTGLVRSEETLERMREAKKGTAPTRAAMEAAWEATRNKIRTPEELETQRLNLSKGTLARSKKVEINGVVYDSINHCARELKIDRGTVKRRISPVM